MRALSCHGLAMVSIDEMDSDRSGRGGGCSHGMGQCSGTTASALCEGGPRGCGEGAMTIDCLFSWRIGTGVDVAVGPADRAPPGGTKLAVRWQGESWHGGG